MLNFIHVLRNEFGRNIHIEPCDILLPKQYLEIELKHQFKEEAKMVEDMMLDSKTNCDVKRLLKWHQELTREQCKVDLICNQIKKLRSSN